MQTLNFAKGHGTLNDFVILTDRDDLVRLDAATVAWLCDRRAGIGGDGLLRAVRAGLVEGWTGDPSLWFMDYRNSDGSIAEMCGNGLRVFVRHLDDQGLIAAGVPVRIATRAGVRTGQVLHDGSVRVSMGEVRIAPHPTWIRHQGHQYRATTVDVGNPHAVVWLSSREELDAVDLGLAPEFDPEVYPSGVNVEFAVADTDQVWMRVHERGVGETMSCGTGVVATAAAHSAASPQHPSTVTVRVPGGALTVELDDEAHLIGPGVIVAHGTVQVPDQRNR